MLMLDMSLFRSNFHCGIIDKSLPDAQQKLAKLHFAWDHLCLLYTSHSAGSEAESGGDVSGRDGGPGKNCRVRHAVLGLSLIHILDTPDLFAWTLVVVLISLAFEKVFLALLRGAVRRSERM